MADRTEIAHEIAPTGAIRAAVNISNAALARINAATGVLTGPSIDLAQALAAETGFPLTILQYPSAAAILAAADRSEWDIAFIAADPSRVDRFSFSPPYAFVTATFLVPAQSEYMRVADVDKPGSIIAAAQGAAYTKQLERLIKHATILHVGTAAEATEQLKAGACHAAAGLKQSLEAAAAEDANLRKLDDAFSEIPQTIAVLREMELAAAFLEEFVTRYTETL